jgi:hypothetical protein
MTALFAGNGVMYAIIDAPNAALTYSGNGSIYGALVGNTITDSGNGAIHFDTALSVASTQSNGNYQTIAFRQLPY